jgi:anti-sigma regulatory factor (Ser/Thr protein kinase)
MTTQQPASDSMLVQTAQMVAIANRQRLLSREAQNRTVATAVAEALRNIRLQGQG